MKKILLLAIPFAFMIACKGKKDESNMTKDSAVQETTAAAEAKPEGEGKPEATAPAAEEKKELTMKDLAGEWSQSNEAEVQGVAKVSAKLKIALKEDGSFAGKQSIMGTSMSVKGTWTLDGKKVKLSNVVGDIETLMYDEKNNTLNDGKSGVHLSRK
jgi:hypothetical protein